MGIYKARARAGEPDVVPELPKATKVGRSNLDGIAQVAARLRAFGDSPAGAAVDGLTYTSSIVTAVRRFQERHRLQNDGVIGAGKFKALNVSLAARVRQIEISPPSLRPTQSPQ